MIDQITCKFNEIGVVPLFFAFNYLLNKEINTIFLKNNKFDN